MRTRSLAAGLLLIGGCVALIALPGLSGEGDPVARPVLPGLGIDGDVQLPNQWSLRPAGRQTELGDFPVNIALHPSGQWARRAARRLRRTRNRRFWR